MNREHTGSIRSFVSVVMLLLAVPTLASEISAVPASNSVQRVLIISSFDRLLPAGIAAEQALRKSVLEGYEKPVEFFTEFLDESRFKIDKLNIVQRDYFRGKYADQQPSLIYCAGNLALKFLAKHKSTLFPEVPIVYIFVTESEASQVRPDARVVGLPISHQYGSTLDLALQLLPDTRRVTLIGGTSEIDVDFISTARQQLAAFENRVDISWKTNQSLSELQETVSGLPKDNIVLYLTFFQDREGKTLHPRAGLEMIAPYSSVPVFGCFDTYVGHGIVGGQMMTFEEAGRKAGEVGVRILGGATPAQAVMGEAHSSVSMFDWRELKKWGIDPGTLPPNAEILFREPSLWDQHKELIIGTVVLILFLVVLIAALLRQLLRRLQAEKLAREAEQAARELSGRLINAQEEERSRIARDLHDDLNQRLSLLSVELDALGRSASGKGFAAELGEIAVQTRNLSTEVHKLAYRLHPAKLTQLGLVSAVASLCRELSQQSGIHVDFSHEDIPRSLPDDVALCAFRVIQESLSNAIRHSGSKKIAVKLTAQTGRLWLQVSDSGKGFLVTPSRCNRRLGLLSMRERARLIDGQLHVRSEPGQGTEVELTVMLPHKEDLS